jgi:hypothetical protein
MPGGEPRSPNITARARDTGTQWQGADVSTELDCRPRLDGF